MEAKGVADATQTAPPPAVGRWRLVWTVLRGCLAGAVCAFGWQFAYIFFGPNLHVVVPGTVYRCSGRVNPDELEKILKARGVRTVVNLCGCCDPLPWYLNETQVTGRLNLSQEDVGFSACRLPSVPAARQLVEVLDHSEYPILIHCHQGIDRTGLASAVYLLLYTDAGLAEARGQLAPSYGHLPFGKTGSIDAFFDLYQEWLDARGFRHSHDNFRRWIEREYCPADCRAAIISLSPADELSRLPARRPLGVRVRCANTSVKPWRMQPGTNAGVHAAWMLVDEQDRYLAEGRSGQFDAVVRPGEWIDLTLSLPSLAPGRYELRVDMIDEQLAWFFQEGSEPLTMALEVR